MYPVFVLTENVAAVRFICAVIQTLGALLSFYGIIASAAFKRREMPYNKTASCAVTGLLMIVISFLIVRYNI